MLKHGIYAVIIGLLCALAADSRADLVVLKTGERVKGKIIKETNTDITIVVYVTSSIKDDRVFKKSEIERMDKVPPDEEGWIGLAGLALGRESLDAEDYDSGIAVLRNYIERFPDSPHVAEAEHRIEQFQQELKRVEAGELKLDGQWIDRSKVLDERIQIGGKILLSRMKRFAASGQPVEAMQVFDSLEKYFGGSASYPDAVTLARQILAMLTSAVEDRKLQLKRRVERDKIRLATAKGAEHDQLEAIFKQEQASLEAYALAGEKSGTKWLPLQYTTDKNIGSIATKVSAEITRLNTITLDKMRLSLIGAQTAATALASHDLASAERSLGDAKNAWANNELVLRLGVQLADAKKAQKAAEDERKKMSKATPTPPPKRP